MVGEGERGEGEKGKKDREREIGGEGEKGGKKEGRNIEVGGEKEEKAGGRRRLPCPLIDLSNAPCYWVRYTVVGTYFGRPPWSSSAPALSAFLLLAQCLPLNESCSARTTFTSTQISSNCYYQYAATKT